MIDLFIFDKMIQLLDQFMNINIKYYTKKDIKGFITKIFFYIGLTLRNNFGEIQIQIWIKIKIKTYSKI